MTREELKRFWFSIPHNPNKTPKYTITVKMDKYKSRKGHGKVSITRDDSNGFSQFTTHQVNPLQYVFNTKEYKSKKYQLIIK